MSLISPLFLFFCFPLMMAIYAFVPQAAKKHAIAVFCALFYLIANINNPFAPVLLLFTVLAVYFISRLIDRQRGQKRVLTAYVAVLIFLAVFILLRFMDPLEINVLSVDYPFGASVWLLCAISCIFDVERGDAPPPSAVEAVAYLAYFPLMVAGPIVKYRVGLTMLGQIEFSFARAARGAEYFMLGFVKRFAVASVLAQMVATLLANVEKGIGIVAVFEFIIIVPIAAYAYFSGYSDMGIGVSMILGLNVPENFNRPLTARSPIEYAKRFMSGLYSFAAEYVGYINPSVRVGRARKIFASSAVFLFVFFWFESDPVKLLFLFPVAFILGLLSGREERRQPMPVRLLTIGATFVSVALFWGYISFDSIADIIPIVSGTFSNFRFGGSLLLYGVSMPKYLLTAIVTVFIVAVFDRVVRGDIAKIPKRSQVSARIAVNIALVCMFAFTLFFYFPQMPHTALI